MLLSRRILFVCLGNICRSPAAEGVLRGLAAKDPKAPILHIESAGTSGMHTGDAPDPRMRRAAAKRGYALNSRARQFQAKDLEEFDLIIPMDQANLEAVLRLASRKEHRSKVVPMATYLTRHAHTSIPDPWYGGPEGFEEVLDLLEDACGNLLQLLTRQQGGGTRNSEGAPTNPSGPHTPAT
ncbi:MAG: low molecular weight protein-tyrosine-phosphatase [Opitutaceae bacterium]|nr:low molecular weight protein-tyrosine-phosphatase [Opitutaceae bacterium]